MNNGDLISREALKKRLGDLHFQNYGNAIMAVMEAPAVGAVEVVHAKWVNAPLCGNDNCRCSNCGSWHNIHANMRGEINYKYCPDCGSRMDGNDNV